MKTTNKKIKISMETTNNEEQAYRKFLIFIADAIALISFVAVLVIFFDNVFAKERDIVDFLKIIAIAVTIIGIWLWLVSSGWIYIVIFILALSSVVNSIDPTMLIPFLVALALASYYVDKRFLRE